MDFEVPQRRSLRAVKPASLAAGRDDLGDVLEERQRALLETIERIRQQRVVWEHRDLVNAERYDGTDGQHFWLTDPYLGYATAPSEATPDWRVECSLPDIQSAIQQYAAQNAASPVQYAGEPVLDSLVTRQAALAATRVIASVRTSSKIVEKRALASLLAMVSGESYLGAQWDVARGRSDVFVARAHEIFGPLGIVDFDEMWWVGRETWVPKETVCARWQAPPEGSPDTPFNRKVRAAARKVRAIEPAVWRIPPVVQQRLRYTGGLDTLVSDDDLATFVRTLSLWVKPGCHKDFPDGYWMEVVGDTPIWEQDALPFAALHLGIPIRRLSFIDMPNRFRGVGMVQLGSPIQSLIEDLVSSLTEHHRLTVSGKILHDSRLNLDGRWTMEAAELVPVDRAALGSLQEVVRVVNPPPTDPAVGRLIGLLSQKLNLYLGANDPNRGITNKDVTLGEIEIAQAAGEARMLTFYRDVDRVERDVMEMCAVLEQSLASDDRKRQMIGEDRESEIEAFNEARFVEEPDGPQTVKIVVQSAPSLSNNAAVKEAQVLNRVREGVMKPEEAREVLEQPLPPGSFTSSWEDNRRLLRELVTRVRRGKSVQIHPLWNIPAMMQAAAQYVTQSQYLDAPDAERAAIDELFSGLEAEFTKRSVGTAAVRGDRSATGNAQAAQLGVGPGPTAPGSQSTQGLTEPTANSTQGFDGSEQPADAGLVGIE